MKDIVQMHWDYFFLLEKDLIAISETIDLCEQNYNAFGPRIVQLVLSAGSELDVALKSFATVISPQCDAATKKQPNMNDFKLFVANNVNSYFSSAQVVFLRTGISLLPWAEVCKNPVRGIAWWDSYNAVKHRRAECYEQGNLETALNLLAALFVVDAYLCEAADSARGGFTQIIDWGHHERLRGRLDLRS